MGARRCVQRFRWLLEMYDLEDLLQRDEDSMEWTAYRLLSVRLLQNLKTRKSDMKLPQAPLIY